MAGPRRGRGRLIVSTVSPDGPADTAGLRKGDIVLGIGTEPVASQAEFYRKLWARGRAGDVIPLKVLQGFSVRDIDVKSIDRSEYFRPVSMH